MKKENGAIVVEATISLTAFMFAILTVIMVLDICYTQAKIGIALNATAKEISQYSYLYSLTGLNGSQEALYAEGLDSRESIDKTSSGVSTVMETISGVKEDYSNYNFDGMVQKIKSCGGDLKEIYHSDEFQYILKDPKNFIIGCAKSGLSDLGEEGKSLLIQILARAFIQKNLAGYSGESANHFLGRLHIEPSGTDNSTKYLEGLNFKGSTFYKMVDGKTTDEVKLVVRYKVKVIRLLNIDFGFDFMQTAATKVWGPGVSQRNKH